MVTVVTLKITKSEKERLREIAKSHGLLIGRGREAEWGSIRQLAMEIAAGNLVVVRSPQAEQGNGSHD